MAAACRGGRIQLRPLGKASQSQVREAGSLDNDAERLRAEGEMR